MKRAILLSLILAASALAQNSEPEMGTLVNTGHSLTQGLVGCWILNEGAGDVINDRGYYNNTSAFTGVPEWGGGQTGYALTCDNDQYVTFGTKLSTISPGQFSVVWSGTPRYNSGASAFFVGQYQYNATGYDWGFYWSATGPKYVFYVKTASAVAVTSTSLIAIGTPVSLVGTYDGANLRLYVNGKLEGGPTAQTGNCTTTYAWKIGHTWNSAYDRMETDFLYAYNRALSDAEATEISSDPYAMFRSSFDLSLYGGLPVPTTGSAQVILISAAPPALILVFSLLWRKKRVR
jgi:hypothetical protein